MLVVVGYLSGVDRCAVTPLCGLAHRPAGQVVLAVDDPAQVVVCQPRQLTVRAVGVPPNVVSSIVSSID